MVIVQLSMLLTIAEAKKKSKIKTRDNILIIGTVGEEGLGDLISQSTFLKTINLRLILGLQLMEEI